MGAIFGFLFGCVVGIIAGVYLITWYIAECSGEDFEDISKKFVELRDTYQNRKKNEI